MQAYRCIYFFLAVIRSSSVPVFKERERVIRSCFAFKNRIFTALKVKKINTFIIMEDEKRKKKVDNMLRMMLFQHICIIYKFIRNNMCAYKGVSSFCILYTSTI